jgi:nicotinate-nucleotide--dimethylbenzimidazole phosphoribosyltransferase
VTDSAAPLPEPSAAARAETATHLDQLTKPVGSLGRLEELAIWAAGVQGRCPPQQFAAIHVIVVAGDHGVARSARTSAYPVEVTAQMVANIHSEGAAVNVLANSLGAALQVVDAGVATDYRDLPVPPGTADRRIRTGSGSIDREDAMTAVEVDTALDLGRTLAADVVTQGGDLLVVGDLGIGNTTAAAALIAALTDGDVVAATGRGTGIDDATWMRKVSAVRDALWRVRDDRCDARALLQRIGGPDLAVMTGLLLGAAEQGLPVILDGVVVTSAALVAERLTPGAARWWLAGHRSVEPAHSVALKELRLEPVLDLRMRLGEGTGALMAIPVLQSAIGLIAGMATFDSAGVSGAQEP